LHLILRSVFFCSEVCSESEYDFFYRRWVTLGSSERYVTAHTGIWRLLRGVPDSTRHVRTFAAMAELSAPWMAVVIKPKSKC